MRFNINIKVIFNNSFQLLSCSLDSLVKNLGRDDFNVQMSLRVILKS